MTSEDFVAPRPRVLYVTKTSILDDGGGGEQRARKVLTGLSSRGFESTVVCGRTRPGFDRWDQYEGCRIRHVWCGPGALLDDSRLGFLLPRYLFAFTNLPVLTFLLAREEFDVVVENMTPYPTLTVFLAKLFGVPIVAVQHEYHGRDCVDMYGPVTGRIQLVVQNLLRLVEYDVIVVPAEYTKRKLREYDIATDRIEVIPNGIDFEDYSGPDIERESNRLVTVGRLCKRKGHDEVIQAFAQLHQEFPELQLDIIGKGPQRQHLEAIATDLGVEDQITFHGFVTNTEKIRILNRAAVFLFASRQEGFGLVLLEAMAAGTPVIARNLPVYKDFFEDKTHGYLVSGDVPSRMTEATSQLLRSPSEYCHISNAARRKAREYGWERVAEQTATIIGTLLKKSE